MSCSSPSCVQLCQRGVWGSGDAGLAAEPLFSSPFIFFWHFLLHSHHPSGYSSAKTTWMTGRTLQVREPPPACDQFRSWCINQQDRNKIVDLEAFPFLSAPDPSVILMEKKKKQQTTKKPTKTKNLHPHPPLLYWKC